MADASGCLTAAIIVTFEPDLRALRVLLDALVGQVERVVIVDNGSTAWSLPATPLPVQRIQLPANLGVATAQNRGLTAAGQLGARFVLLLDQDSCPAGGMTRQLLEAFDAAAAAGLKVAAAGPCIVDPRGKCEGFVSYRAGHYEATAPQRHTQWVACDLLISSGSLLSLAAVKDIGAMAEELFIDKVDIEWSLRAAARGYRLIGVPQAQLNHRLGERALRLWFGHWRVLPQHRPFRYYYMLRNAQLLRRLPHANVAWRRADRRQQLSLLLYFGLLAPGRWDALRMMVRGWWDGVRGISGPLR